MPRRRVFSSHSAWGAAIGLAAIACAAGCPTLGVAGGDDATSTEPSGTAGGGHVTHTASSSGGSNASSSHVGPGGDGGGGRAGVGGDGGLGGVGASSSVASTGTGAGGADMCPACGDGGPTWLAENADTATTAIVQPTAIAVAGGGAFYVAGTYVGAPSFCGDGALVNATSRSLFLARYTASGSCDLSFPHGTDHGGGEGIAGIRLGLSPDEGALYLSLTYLGNPPNFGGVLAMSSSESIYVAQLTPDFSRVWSASFTGAPPADGSQRRSAGAVEVNGKAWTVGSFSALTYFGSAPVSPVNGTTGFVRQLSAGDGGMGTLGDLRWSPATGGGAVVPTAVGAVGAGFVVVGNFSGDTVTFSRAGAAKLVKLTPAASGSGFVTYLDRDGDVQWAQLVDAPTSGRVAMRDVVADSDHIYVVGNSVSGGVESGAFVQTLAVDGTTVGATPVGGSATATGLAVHGSAVVVVGSYTTAPILANRCGNSLEAPVGTEAFALFFDPTANCASGLIESKPAGGTASLAATLGAVRWSGTNPIVAGDFIPNDAFQFGTKTIAKTSATARSFVAELTAP